MDTLETKTETKPVKKCPFVVCLFILIGAVMIIGGLWGIYFTYSNIAAEKIVTPEDASISKAPVRGPFTLKAQADIIREHTLKTTKGKTFAEMPRTIAKLDGDNNPVLNEKGEPVMVPNTARDMWITATTLTTALNLAILSYAFSAVSFAVGLISVLIGGFFLSTRKKCC